MTTHATRAVVASRLAKRGDLFDHELRDEVVALTASVDRPSRGRSINHKPTSGGTT